MLRTAGLIVLWLGLWSVIGVVVGALFGLLVPKDEDDDVACPVRKPGRPGRRHWMDKQSRRIAYCRT